MSDEDLFARLFELFNQPGPVNWSLAAEAAKSIAGEADPVDPWLAEEYQELTRVAQMTISDAAPLPVLSRDAVPVDRRGWALENIRGFRYLVEPLASKMEMGDVGEGADALEAILRPMAPALLGLQVGVLVGFLSHRVLGQFDIGLPSAEASRLFLIVPNIEGFAISNDLEPRQVRLWVALHEVTHDAEFGRDWVRPRFIELIEQYLDGIELDVEGLTRLQTLQDPAALEELLDEPGGLPGWIVSDEQKPILEKIQAFMAVMEGYSDWLMDRAAPDLLPDLARMRAAIERRRAEPAEGEQILNRLLGLDLKMQQYELGSKFCTQVESRWGRDALDRLWEHPDHLPSLTELEDPLAWAARVLLEDMI
ncbi:MAG: zinc-dependent metalloprotease [Acidimicrobiia bacterium]